MNKPFAVHRLMPNDIVTEDSAAKQFVELHGDKIRYCHSHGKWFHWNGFYWEINDTSLAFHFARELARQLAENEDYRRRYKIEATSFAGGVERFAKADPKVAVTMKSEQRSVAAGHAGRHRRSAHRRIAAQFPGRGHHQNYGGVPER